MVVPHYPTQFSCTCFARLRELGGDAFSSDAALSGPDDQGAAPVDPELLIEGGADHVAVHAESGFHQVPTPQAWWSGVMGSGYRGTVDQLSAEDLERVRSSNLTYIRESGIHQVEANVVYGVATKFSL